MSEILSNGRLDDGRFGLVPTYSGSQAMNFQTQKGLECQENMKPSRRRFSGWIFLHSTILLDTSMVDFDSPSLLCQHFPLFWRHGQFIGGPVFHVPVPPTGLRTGFGDYPEHLNEPIALQMDLPP